MHAGASHLHGVLKIGVREKKWEHGVRMPGVLPHKVRKP